MSLRLSKNFVLKEFLVSKEYPQIAKELSPTSVQRCRLILLCQSVLQPIRDHFGHPVIILSGLRSRKLNELIGGAVDSDHLYGAAADFYVLDKDIKEVFYLSPADLPYRQMILHSEEGFIHISINFPCRLYKRERFSVS